MPIDEQFAEIGNNITIYPGARILNRPSITVGSNVIIDDFVFIGQHRRIIIGNHVHIASHASITGGGECICCDFSGISSGARILTGTDDLAAGGLTGPTIPPDLRAVIRGRVGIGPHAVIGANAVVLPNVVIGTGAIIGAGSVVTRSLDAWGIYTGAPARQIGTRDATKTLALEAELFAREGVPEKRFLDVGLL